MTPLMREKCILCGKFAVVPAYIELENGTHVAVGKYCTNCGNFKKKKN